MTQATATESAPRRRRWFRFSLRSLLIFTTLVGAGLGWVGKERMQSWREDQFAKGHPTRFIEWQPQENWWKRLRNFVLGPRVFRINLLDPKFNDLTPLAGMTHLQCLNLSSTQVTDLTPLAGMTNLQCLWLNSTAVTDLTPLAGLTNLQVLDLDSTPVTDLTPLAGLKNVQGLSLYATAVTDLTPLAGLKNLQMLYLVPTQATDLTPLTGLKNLQTLGLEKTRLTDEQVKWLQEKLPNCNIF